jgi:hypothetical protein
MVANGLAALGLERDSEAEAPADEEANDEGDEESCVLKAMRAAMILDCQAVAKSARRFPRRSG